MDYNYMSVGGFYESPFVPLIIGFIGLIFLAWVADVTFKVLNKLFTDRLFPRFKMLPDHLSDEAAALVIVILLYEVCYWGQFDFSAYIGFSFPSPGGYVATAIASAAGTNELRSRFETMSLIPMSIGSGLLSTATRAVRGITNGNNQTG
ncbi:MAG TPA: hypothetical protein DEF34_03440 [Desulfotomaculum sp.]|nr:MAG: hypothetical protein JL56_03050 [Desulfotomaculum sp. BICA1-6]HBX22682.1 hypothetical protein [Desulfotomaculum sp.]